MADFFAAFKKTPPQTGVPWEDYDSFIINNSPNADELNAMQKHKFYFMPKFAIMPLGTFSGELFNRTMRSLQAQAYTKWSFLADGNENVDWDYIVLLAPGDVLNADALYEFASTINDYSDVDVVFADEDVYSKNDKFNRTAPVCKGIYSEITLLSYNSVGRPMAISRSLYFSVGGISGDDLAAEYDYTIRCCTNASKIQHIKKILLTRYDASSFINEQKGICSITARLHSVGQKSFVEGGAYNGSFRVRTQLQKKLQTDIIIPNRNNALGLRRLLESIEECSFDERYRLIIVDADSKDPQTLRYYNILSARRAAKIISVTSQNFAVLANTAAEESNGDSLLFISPYARVTSLSWLRSLCEQAFRRDVGIVGAKLISPEQRILHAGYSPGFLGVVGSPFYSLPNSGGYLRKEHFVNTMRAVSAVSSCCMMIKNDAFFGLGKFDETFVEGGADVEFCIRAWRHNMACVYTPFCELVLYEPPKNLDTVDEATRQRLQDTLRPVLVDGDPFFSSLWSKETPQVSISPLQQKGL